MRRKLQRSRPFGFAGGNDRIVRECSQLRRRPRRDRPALLAVFRVGLASRSCGDLGSRAGTFTAFTAMQACCQDALVPQRSPFFAYLLDGSASSRAWSRWWPCRGSSAAVGLATRVATVLSWFLLGSLHLRNPRCSTGPTAICCCCSSGVCFASRRAVVTRRAKGPAGRRRLFAGQRRVAVPSRVVLPVRGAAEAAPLAKGSMARPRRAFSRGRLADLARRGGRFHIPAHCARLPF